MTFCTPLSQGSALAVPPRRKAALWALAGLLAAHAAGAAEPAARPISPAAGIAPAQPAAAAASPASPSAQAGTATALSGDPSAAFPLPQPPSLVAGKAAFAEGDYAAAEGMLELASAEAGDLAETWNYLGNVRWKLGKREAALDAYERCLELKPEQPELRAFVRLQRPRKRRGRRNDLEFSPAAQSPQEPPQPGFLDRHPWIRPLWRSTLLPGWGQVYKGEKRKGLIVGVLCAGSLAVALVTRNSAAQARAEYETLPPGLPDLTYEGPRKRWSTWSAISLGSFVAFGVTYGLNLVDAGWQGDDEQQPPAPQSGALRLAPLGDGLQARLELARF